MGIICGVSRLSVSARKNKIEAMCMQARILLMIRGSAKDGQLTVSVRYRFDAVVAIQQIFRDGIFIRES